MLVNLQLLVNFGLIPCSRSRDCYFNMAMGLDCAVGNKLSDLLIALSRCRRLNCEGHSSTRLDRLKLNPHTTFVVEVEGVIDVQGVQHTNSIQIVTHRDINPVQQGLTS